MLLKELKQELKQRGLSVSGNKSVLQKRLDEALAAENKVVEPEAEAEAEAEGQNTKSEVNGVENGAGAESSSDVVSNETSNPSNGKGKKSKRAERRARAKQKKKELQAREQEIRKRLGEEKGGNTENQNNENKSEKVVMATAKAKSKATKETDARVEYIPEEVQLEGEAAAQFENVFKVFFNKGKEKDEEGEMDAGEMDVEEDSEGEEDTPKGLSNRKKKEIQRLSVAELKQLVSRPDVVEIHDCNAPDPQLLVYLKSLPNTVSVPKHWLSKSKYLQRKRGIEKPAFVLPQFIHDTGITELRNQQQEVSDAKSSKQKARDRVRPKMGKLDIDYQILHDAFFRYQTKPKMTGHGDTYYEGKEFQVKMFQKKPGELSLELMNALGMKNGKLSPPPYLRAMQRYGPPPSYPNLKIPGVNHPLPAGAEWGPGEDQWGTAPVNEMGISIWGGDVYGGMVEEAEAEVDHTLWGLVQEEEEEESSDEDSVDDMDMSEEDEEEDAGVDGGQSMLPPGLATTPADVRLRKHDGTGTETPGTVQGSLYTVLEERKTSLNKGDIMGSTFTYVLPEEVQLSKEPDSKKRKKAVLDEVEVALTPEEMAGLDAEALQAKYQQKLEQVRMQKAAARADIDEVIAEHSNLKKRKPN